MAFFQAIRSLYILTRTLERLGLNQIEVLSDREAATMRPIRALSYSSLSSMYHCSIMRRNKQPDRKWYHHAELGSFRSLSSDMQSALILVTHLGNRRYDATQIPHRYLQHM